MSFLVARERRVTAPAQRGVGCPAVRPPRPPILLLIRPAACSALSVHRLLLVELSLALYCQHVPSRRHFLKFLFVTWVHQGLGKLPTVFGETVVLQYSLHDAIPQSIKTAG
jgi:hypothetical protein